MNEFVKNLLIVGETGTGKSTSMRNLPLEKTIWINTEKKLLPFKGANKLYKNVNLKTVDEMLSGMAWIEEQEDVEYVVLDSFTMLMDMFYMEKIATADPKRTQQAWGEYKTYGMNVLEAMKQSKKFYIVTAQEKDTTDQFGIVDGNYASCQGSLFKLVEGHFTIVAFTNVVTEKDKDPEYGFVLGKTKKRALVSAKAPFDFLDGQKELHDNDVMPIINEIKEYTGE